MTRLFYLIPIILVIFFADIIIRIYKPQLTYSNVHKYSPDCFVKNPILPFSLRSNYPCKMINYYGDYNSVALLNSLGYRGTELMTQKAKDTKRILVIGDSMTFGQGVSDEQTYPSKLEQILKPSFPKVEIINAGYADGFSPDSYLVYLKNRGFNLKPDVIILGFFVWNDITDLSETVWDKVDNYGLPIQVSSCCRMIDQGIYRNKITEKKYQIPVLRESHLFILLSNLLSKINNGGANDLLGVRRDLFPGCILDPDCIYKFKPEEEKTYKILRGIKRLSDENNSKLIIALIPVDLQIYPDAGKKYGLTNLPSPDNIDFIQKRLSRFFQENNITYLDLLPYFRDQKNRGYPFFPNDAHLNSLGNQIIAESMANFLLKISAL